MHQGDPKETSQDDPNEVIENKKEHENKNKTMEKTIKDMETKIKNMEEENEGAMENNKQLNDCKALSVKLMEKGKNLDKLNQELKVENYGMKKEYKQLLDKHE